MRPARVHGRILGWPLALALSLPRPSASDPGSEAGFSDRAVLEGIAVGAEIEPLREGSGKLREGETVEVRLRLSDAASGAPLAGLYPAAWMDLVPEARSERQPDACKQKVEAFIGGSLLTPPELDLNAYYVLALNEDATISVVDPLFGFGGSKLLAMVFLDSPGEDWALAPDGRRLYVSLPDSDRVAVVDTASWKVEANLEVGGHPGRLALQADGRYLWVAYRRPLAGAQASGVAVVDTASLEGVRQVATGRGDHDLALSADDRFAFVTNQEDGTVSVIEVATLEVLATLATGARPVSVAFSPRAQAAYASHEADGSVVAVDGSARRVVARVAAEPGLGQIRFAPGGRLGFVVNPGRNLIHVLDAATNRIVQTGDMLEEPDQVSFSQELAYVRHRGSEAVLMIPLKEVGREGAAIPVVDFPGGQNPPGKMAKPTPAAGIVQAPGANAVLVANPHDKAIYYYQEGMAAPMGHFQNYGRRPRAVQVVDRSLKEKAPGLYRTVAKLGRAGTYDLAVFLDSPRVVHCFSLQVAEDPTRRREVRPLQVRPLGSPPEVRAGEEVALQFALTEPATGQPRSGLEDVGILTFLAPGIWQRRQWAEEVGAGVYEIRFTPPRPGIYYVFVECPSLKVRYRDVPALVLRAAGP